MKVCTCCCWPVGVLKDKVHLILDTLIGIFKVGFFRKSPADTTPASGPISMSMVNTELGISATTVITLNDAAVRTLFNRWCNESQGLLDPDDRCLLSSSCLSEQTYSISRAHHNLLRFIKKRLFFAFAHKPDHFDPAASDDVA